MQVESERETNQRGFCPKSLEMFLLTSKTFLLDENPMVLEVIGFLKKKDAISALCLIKVMRNERGIALPKSFGRVERLVYASI